MARVAHGGNTGRVTRAGWTPAPTPGADRLREQLHDRVEAYRAELSDELAIVAALMRMGAIEPAAHALDEERRRVRALADGLEGVLSSAMPYRQRGTAVGTAGRPAPQGRLRLAGALAAALLGLGILLPGLHQQPVTDFGMRAPAGGGQSKAEQQEAARTALRDARLRLAELEAVSGNAAAVTAEARALHDRILALSDAALADEELRREIQYLLLEQSTALAALEGHPEAESLLAEVRALSASLGIPLDPIELPPVPLEALPLPEELPEPPQPPQPEQPEAPAPSAEPREPRLLEGEGSHRPDSEGLQLERQDGVDGLERTERPAGEGPRFELGR